MFDTEHLSISKHIDLHFGIHIFLDDNLPKRYKSLLTPALIDIYTESILIMPLSANRKETRVRFHTSSVLSPAPNQLGSDTHALAIGKLPTEWLVFEEMMRAHRMAHIRCCTAVSSVTVSIFAGPAKLPHDVVREAEAGAHGE